MDRLGPAASLDPSARLLCLALLSSASLAARPSFSAVVAVTAVLLLKMAGLSFARILRDSAFVAVFLLFAAALRYFDFSRERHRPSRGRGVYRSIRGEASGRLSRRPPFLCLDWPFRAARRDDEDSAAPPPASAERI